MSDVKSSTFKRILSAAVALPVYVYALAADSFLNIPLLAVTLVITLACLYEFYQISDKGEGRRPLMAFGLAAGAALNVIMYLYAFGKVYGYTRYIEVFDARVAFAALALFLSVILIYQLFRRPIAGSIYSLSVTVFGVAYIVFSFSHVILLKALKDGFFYIFILNVVVMLNDTGGYFGGVLLGKHKVNFPVSPNKSWEGYFTGLLFSVISMIITNYIYEIFYARHLFSMIEAVLLGIGLSFFGNIGDLVESLAKRDGAIKDSGSLIPGHGGMWDVFDALVFTMPLFYYYLVLKGVQ